MRKLNYIANIRMPTERAHGIQIVKTCESLSQFFNLTLVVPNRYTKLKSNIFGYYKVGSVFKVKKLPCIDSVFLGKIGYILELTSFSISVFWYYLTHRDIFYTRDLPIACLLRLIGKDVIWESHFANSGLFVRLAILLKIPIVVITDGLRTHYLNLGVAEEMLFVVPDAVDINQFDLGISKDEARMSLGIKSKKPLIIYSGSLLPWKGVETFKRASDSLPEYDFMIVKGEPYYRVPLFLQAADVLVIPNTGDDKTSRLYTSPMKMFEYMASGRPILASNIPSLREVLNDNNAFFFEADNPDSLADNLNKMIKEEALLVKKSNQARVDVEAYSWSSRAELLYTFIRKHYSNNV